MPQVMHNRSSAEVDMIGADEDDPGPDRLVVQDAMDWD